MDKKPSVDELAKKYAEQYLWVQNARQNEGWGDTLETKKVLLVNLIKKAFEERE